MYDLLTTFSLYGQCRGKYIVIFFLVFILDVWAILLKVACILSVFFFGALLDSRYIF